MPDYAPATRADLTSLVRDAQAQRTPLFPRGGGTMHHHGRLPARSGATVDLTRLRAVIDYPARDMTITVQAGIRLQQLHDLLQQENQRLPIDVPLPELATLGGAIAANASGPRRFGHGTFRDYLLGIHAINDEGQDIKAGGRVVKNVAGYDLCKLFTGSYGTLGILTQVTLKVRPAPETSLLLGAYCPLSRLGEMLDRLQSTRTRPCALEVLSPQTALDVGGSGVPDLGSPTPLDPQAALILLGFEDNADAVRWQSQQIRTELTALHLNLAGTWDGMDHPLWAALRDYTLRTSPFTFQASLPASRVAEFLCLALPIVPRLLAHAGNGVVIGHVGETFSRAQLQQLRAVTESHGGSLILHRCPDDWRQAEILWGSERKEFALMRRIKRQLDPQGIFNPGRFVSG